jgi:RHS repeat-associated protein
VAERFTYTATGKRATMTDASGTTTYTYDDHDRLAAKATPQGTLSYTYDPAGNVASMQSSNVNGVSVAYTYDSLNRLATVVDNRLPNGLNTTTYTYDPASNLATVTYPNGLQSSFTYDDLNRVTALNNGKASYSYTLGPTGSRQSAAESSGRTLSWNYDGIYRLTNETISLDPMSKNGTVAYGLDPVGNRQTQTSSIPGIPTASFYYDADDRILSTESYDANGNTTVSGSRTFTYDFANRLKSMNGGAVTLLYDGDGNRVAKTVGGVTTRYLVDDLNPTGYAQVVEEIGGTGVQRAYTYGLQRINQSRIVSGSGAPSFYGYDGTEGGGTVRLLTDSTGTVTDTYDYDAFGNVVNSTGTTPNSYRYGGEQYDADLGLYYLRARSFNPATGRFLTGDPYPGDITAPSTLHRYTYASADPMNRRDPSGRADITEATLLDAFILTESVIASPKAKEMADDIWCIWDLAFSWLKLALWVDQLPPDALITGVVRNECQVRAGIVRGPGKCPWHRETRPLKGSFGLSPGTCVHEYFYNVDTGGSLGLGGVGSGLVGTVPGKWETGEKPGVDQGPVDDDICDCVGRRIREIQNGPAPPYFALRWFPRETAASNCWAWVSSIERQCRLEVR